MTVREATVWRLIVEREEARAQVRDIEFRMNVLGYEVGEQLLAADAKLAILERELKYHEDIARAEREGWTKQV